MSCLHYCILIHFVHQNTLQILNIRIDLQWISHVPSMKFPWVLNIIIYIHYKYIYIYGERQVCIGRSFLRLFFVWLHFSVFVVFGYIWDSGISGHCNIVSISVLYIEAFYAKAMLHFLEGMPHHVRNASCCSINGTYIYIYIYIYYIYINYILYD